MPRKETPVSRPSGRAIDELRPVRFELGFTKHADGSALAQFGGTRVLCTASIEAAVPRFLRGSGRGWVTAEYGMLPGATHTRGRREAVAGGQTGRSKEIQRLIGRSLRACVDFEALGEHTVTIDCDVLQADGGTRAASVRGLAGASPGLSTVRPAKEILALPAAWPGGRRIRRTVSRPAGAGS